MHYFNLLFTKSKSDIACVCLLRSHLNSWRRIGHSIRSKRTRWGLRQKPKTELIKELKLTNDSEIAYDEDQVEDKNVDRSIEHSIDARRSQIIRRMQLLQFDKSHRPAFYGVWPRKS